MSANVETMFSVRETPWHGLGRIVMDAPASREALELAGLDWQVESRNIYSGTGAMIPGYRANVRSTDDAVLGVVSDRYRIVQNEEAFQFTDDLLGEGVTYETAGSLQGGKKVWMLAKLPEKYIIAGDEVTPYLVFFNSHDGSSGVKVAMTPVRVVCQNTLNLALNNAKRIWTARHLIGQFRLILRFDIRTDKFFGIGIKIAHFYGFQGSWNVIPRIFFSISGRQTI